MTKNVEFFHQESQAISADEFKRLGSPEVVGQELVLNVKGWIEKAAATLSGHSDLIPVVDLEAPEWIDLLLPDHAIHELHRVCLKLPKHMPSAKCMKTLTSQEKDAIGVLYRIKRFSNAFAGLGVPAASAVVITKASFDLGFTIAEAHVTPWEPLAESGWKSKDGGGTGGKKPKRRQWAEWACHKAKCWDDLPDSTDPWEFSPNEMVVLEIYRDGDSLIAADPDTGREHKLARSSIEKRYLKKG